MVLISLHFASISGSTDIFSLLSSSWSDSVEIERLSLLDYSLEHKTAVMEGEVGD